MLKPWLALPCNPIISSEKGRTLISDGSHVFPFFLGHLAARATRDSR